MKVKKVLEKGKRGNSLRGPRMIKKMKNPAKKIVRVLKTDPKLCLKGDELNQTPRILKRAPVKKQAIDIQKEPKIIPAGDDCTLNKLGITREIIKDSIKIVTDLHDEHKKGAKATILNDKDAVYLQIVWIKKPEVPDQRRKFVRLHHGLFGDDPEVCLLVKDYIPYDKIKRTPDEKIEYTIDYYQEILKLHDVKNISTIMPMFQLRTEYDSYQLKRKLVDRFDLFLSQSNLLDDQNYFKNIGIAFTKKNKVPLTIKFPHDLKKPDPKFAENVSSLIRSTWFTLKPHSDTVSMRIGNVTHTQQQLFDNLQHVLYQLTQETADALPGGVQNLRSIMLKTSRSKVVPLYINLTSSETVPVPILKSVKAKGKVTEGELTTQLGKKVTVMPDGEVFVTDDPDEKVPAWWNSDDEGSDDDDNKQDNSTDDSGPAEEEQITEPNMIKNKKKQLTNIKEPAANKKNPVKKKVNEKHKLNSDADTSQKLYLKRRCLDGAENADDKVPPAAKKIKQVDKKKAAAPKSKELSIVKPPKAKKSSTPVKKSVKANKPAKKLDSTTKANTETSMKKKEKRKH